MSFSREYHGRSYYLSEHRSGPHRLIVGVECRIGSMADAVYMLLDTAAEWCVLPPEVAEELGDEVDTVPLQVALHTRLGIFSGQLARVPVRFIATDGQSLTVDATWFVCPDWPGPAVIGWKGCLERFRFALEPGEEAFYFAEL